MTNFSTIDLAQLDSVTGGFDINRMVDAGNRWGTAGALVGGGGGLLVGGPAGAAIGGAGGGALGFIGGAAADAYQQYKGQ